MGQYKMTMHGSILKDLGINLYSSLSSVISEIIANSYDADASVVKVILFSELNKIIVLDNGIGMSEEDINLKFLSVGLHKRTKNSDNLTQVYKRSIMGRKGIGKLAPLAISETLEIYSLKDKEISGCKIIKEDLLSNDGKNHYEPISVRPDSINEFEWIKEQRHGTMLILSGVEKDINRNRSYLRKIVAKSFPVEDTNFIIMIDGKEISPKDLNYFSKLEYILDLSDDSRYIKKSKNVEVFRHYYDTEKFSPQLGNEIVVNFGDHTKKFKVNGWIGCVKDLSNLKVVNTDEIGYTTDNRISIYARNKLGEYNILPIVSTNQGHDSYLIGEIYADFLEDTNYDDIAISSREGYIKTDPRYKSLIEFVKKAVRIIINIRVKDKKKQKEEDLKLKREDIKRKDRELFKYIDEISDQISDKTKDTLIRKVSNVSKTKIDKEILYGGDKVLISHSSRNKMHADFILSLLRIIGVPDEKIIYTSSDIGEHKVPFGNDIFDYLYDEFRKDIYVCFVIDNTFKNRFACVSEAGASWVTNKDYGIFLAEDVQFPQGIDYKPLNFSKIGVHLKSVKTKETRIALKLFKNTMVKRFKLKEPKGFSENLDNIISEYINKFVDNTFKK